MSRRTGAPQQDRSPFRDWFRDIRGSLTTEAALMLPGFIAFGLSLVCLVGLGRAELALQSAVSETAKSIAAHWYPVQMIYTEVKQSLRNSTAGQRMEAVWKRVTDIRDTVQDVESLAQEYERLLPEPIVQVLAWEKQKREAMETGVVEYVEGKIIDPLLAKAFRPIVLYYASGSLDHERLVIESVDLPAFEPGGDPYVEITASYTVKLPIPFVNKSFRLVATAKERAWVGDGS